MFNLAALAAQRVTSAAVYLGSGPMATYAGIDLGFIFWMSTSPAPIGRQVNAYSGANGLEVLNHGGRGGQTAIEGATISLTAGGLGQFEQTMRSLQQQGNAATLVDTLAVGWPNVILVAFAPKGPIRPRVGGGFARRYEAEFLHVS